MTKAERVSAIQGALSAVDAPRPAWRAVFEVTLEGLTGVPLTPPDPVPVPPPPPPPDPVPTPVPVPVPFPGPTPSGLVVVGLPDVPAGSVCAGCRYWEQGSGAVPTARWSEGADGTPTRGEAALEGRCRLLPVASEAWSNDWCGWWRGPVA